jgi:hypothetical protein
MLNSLYDMPVPTPHTPVNLNVVSSPPKRKQEVMRLQIPTSSNIIGRKKQIKAKETGTNWSPRFELASRRLLFQSVISETM